MLCPFVVSLTDSGVPPVDQVELSRDLVSSPDCRAIWNDHAWVELPVVVGSVEVQDNANVIDQDDVDVKSTCDEPGSLEEIIVTLIEAGTA